MKQFEPGHVIDDRFVLEELIGSGGMGSVYLAKQLELNRMVAIKLLQLEHYCETEEKQRFLREGLILSKLSHPNIPVFFHFGMATASCPYMAFELLEGVSLREKLALLGGRLEWQETIRIAIEVCNALEYAHAQGVIHRDIKPDNIFICEPDTAVKVIDFGLSTFSGESARTQRLTGTGMLIGSIYYMSPEQCRGERPEFASDLYALGCVIHECIAGRPVFESDSPMNIIYKQANESPPSLADAGATVPSQVQNVVSKALAKHPTERFQSASEMRNALQLCLNLPTEVKHSIWKNSWRQVIGCCIALVVVTACLFTVSAHNTNFLYEDVLHHDSNIAIPVAERMLEIQQFDCAADLALLCSETVEQRRDEPAQELRLRLVGVLSRSTPHLDKRRREMAYRRSIAMISRLNKDGSQGAAVLHCCRKLAESLQPADTQLFLELSGPLVKSLRLASLQQAALVLGLAMLQPGSVLGKEDRVRTIAFCCGMIFQQNKCSIANTWFQQLLKKNLLSLSTEADANVLHGAAQCALRSGDFKSLNDYCKRLIATKREQEVAIACRLLSLAHLALDEVKEAVACARLAKKLELGGEVYSPAQLTNLLYAASPMKNLRKDIDEFKRSSAQCEYVALLAFCKAGLNAEAVDSANHLLELSYSKDSSEILEYKLIGAATLIRNNVDTARALTYLRQVKLGESNQSRFENAALRLVCADNSLDVEKVWQDISQERRECRIILRALHDLYCGSDEGKKYRVVNSLTINPDRSQDETNRGHLPISLDLARALCYEKQGRLHEARAVAKDAIFRSIVISWWEPGSALIPLVLPLTMDDAHCVKSSTEDRSHDSDSRNGLLRASEIAVTL